MNNKKEQFFNAIADYNDVDAGDHSWTMHFYSEFKDELIKAGFEEEVTESEEAGLDYIYFGWECFENDWEVLDEIIESIFPKEWYLDYSCNG